MPVPQESLFVVEQVSCLLLKSSSLFPLPSSFFLLPSFTVLDCRGRGGPSYLFSQALWVE